MLRDAKVLARARRLRWTAFALVAAAYVLSFFHRIAPAAIAEELQRAFSASGAELGALAATYFFIYTLMQIPTGILVDAFGPRRIAAAGGVIAGAGAILFGAAGSFGVAGVGRALVGLGVSVTFVCLLKLVAAWFFTREFATLSGLVMFLGNMGAVLSATPLAWAVTLTSWRSIFVGIGLASLAGAALTALLVRDDPVQAGLPSMRELEGGVAPPPAARPAAAPWHAGIRRVMRNPATWPGFFVNLGIAGTFFTFAGLWAVPFLTGAHGMSRERATLHTSTMLVAFAFGALATGKISDRLGRRRPVILLLGLLYSACWVPWLLVDRLPVAIGFVLFAVMGACATAFILSWSNAKEVNPPELSGTAIAVVNVGVFLGPTIYQPLVGWVLDRSGFRAGLAVLAALALMGALSALFVRDRGAAGDRPRS